MRTIFPLPTVISRLNRWSWRTQQGFATTAKVMVVALSVAGVGLVATANRDAGFEAQRTDAVTGAASTTSPRLESDPDAELREWLREPQPPTF